MERLQCYMLKDPCLKLSTKLMYILYVSTEALQSVFVTINT